MAEIGSTIGTVYPVKFTPDGEAAVWLQGVTDINWSDGGPLETFYCDGNTFPEFAAMVSAEQTIGFTMHDLTEIVSAGDIVPGANGVLTVYLPDRTGAGYAEDSSMSITAGGGGTPQTDGCMFNGFGVNASQGSIAAPMSMSFGLKSDDGTTSPLAYSTGVDQPAAS